MKNIKYTGESIFLQRGIGIHRHLKTAYPETDNLHISMKVKTYFTAVLACGYLIHESMRRITVINSKAACHAYR